MLRRIFWVAVLLLLVGGFVAAKNFLKADTTIKQGTPSVTHVDIATPKTRTVTERMFRLELPEDWRSKEPMAGADYSWTSTEKTTTGRSLDIFVDGATTDLAFNRLLPVQASDEGVEAIGDISANCTTFTDEKATINPQGVAPSKWAGISFLCDMANTQRNVIGTSAAESRNNVTITGSKGIHRYTFVYTDHGARPSENVFLDIIKSFKAL
jgi:hypothetical protein